MWNIRIVRFFRLLGDIIRISKPNESGNGICPRGYGLSDEGDFSQQFQWSSKGAEADEACTGRA